MLAIRMQRTGRKGLAMFRIIVQDSRRTPTSGKLVAQLGHYDPHAKTLSLDKNKADFYLSHGAKPSPRVANLLQSEGVKLPDWVEEYKKKTSTTKHPDKLRKNRQDEVIKNSTEQQNLPDETVEAVTAEVDEDHEDAATPATVAEDKRPEAEAA